VHIILIMGITVNDPTNLNIYEIPTNGNLLLEFVNKNNKDFVRFETTLQGTKKIADVLNKWIHEKEQSNGPKEDRDSS